MFKLTERVLSQSSDKKIYKSLEYIAGKKEKKEKIVLKKVLFFFFLKKNKPIFRYFQLFLKNKWFLDMIFVHKYIKSLGKNLFANFYRKFLSGSASLGYKSFLEKSLEGKLFKFLLFNFFRFLNINHYLNNFNRYTDICRKLLLNSRGDLFGFKNLFYYPFMLPSFFFRSKYISRDFSSFSYLNRRKRRRSLRKKKRKYLLRRSRKNRFFHIRVFKQLGPDAFKFKGHRVRRSIKNKKFLKFPYGKAFFWRIKRLRLRHRKLKSRKRKYKRVRVSWLGSLGRLKRANRKRSGRRLLYFRKKYFLKFKVSNKRFKAINRYGSFFSRQVKNGFAPGAKLRSKNMYMFFRSFLRRKSFLLGKNSFRSKFKLFRKDGLNSFLDSKDLLLSKPKSFFFKKARFSKKTFSKKKKIVKFKKVSSFRKKRFGVILSRKPRKGFKKVKKFNFFSGKKKRKAVVFYKKKVFFRKKKSLKGLGYSSIKSKSFRRFRRFGVFSKTYGDQVSFKNFYSFKVENGKKKLKTMPDYVLGCKEHFFGLGKKQLCLNIRNSGKFLGKSYGVSFLPSFSLNSSLVSSKKSFVFSQRNRSLGLSLLSQQKNDFIFGRNLGFLKKKLLKTGSKKERGLFSFGSRMFFFEKRAYPFLKKKKNFIGLSRRLFLRKSFKAKPRKFLKKKGVTFRGKKARLKFLVKKLNSFSFKKYNSTKKSIKLGGGVFFSLKKVSKGSKKKKMKRSKIFSFFGKKIKMGGRGIVSPLNGLKLSHKYNIHKSKDLVSFLYNRYFFNLSSKKERVTGNFSNKYSLDGLNLFYMKGISRGFSKKFKLLNEVKMFRLDGSNRKKYRFFNKKRLSKFKDLAKEDEVFRNFFMIHKKRRRKFSETKVVGTSVNIFMDPVKAMSFKKGFLFRKFDKKLSVKLDEVSPFKFRFNLKGKKSVFLHKASFNFFKKNSEGFGNYKLNWKFFHKSSTFNFLQKNNKESFFLNKKKKNKSLYYFFNYVFKKRSEFIYVSRKSRMKGVFSHRRNIEEKNSIYGNSLFLKNNFSLNNRRKVYSKDFSDFMFKPFKEVSSIRKPLVRKLAPITNLSKLSDAEIDRIVELRQKKIRAIFLAKVQRSGEPKVHAWKVDKVRGLWRGKNFSNHFDLMEVNSVFDKRAKKKYLGVKLTGLYSKIKIKKFRKSYVLASNFIGTQVPTKGFDTISIINKKQKVAERSARRSKGNSKNFVKNQKKLKKFSFKSGVRSDRLLISLSKRYKNFFEGSFILKSYWKNYRKFRRANKALLKSDKDSFFRLFYYRTNKFHKFNILKFKNLLVSNKAFLKSNFSSRKRANAIKNKKYLLKSDKGRKKFFFRKFKRFRKFGKKRLFFKKKNAYKRSNIYNSLRNKRSKFVAIYTNWDRLKKQRLKGKVFTVRKDSVYRKKFSEYKNYNKTLGKDYIHPFFGLQDFEEESFFSPNIGENSYKRIYNLRSKQEIYLNKRFKDYLFKFSVSQRSLLDKKDIFFKNFKYNRNFYNNRKMLSNFLSDSSFLEKKGPFYIFENKINKGIRFKYNAFAFKSSLGFFEKPLGDVRLDDSFFIYPKAWLGKKEYNLSKNIFKYYRRYGRSYKKVKKTNVILNKTFKDVEKIKGLRVKRGFKVLGFFKSDGVYKVSLHKSLVNKRLQNEKNVSVKTKKGFLRKRFFLPKFKYILSGKVKKSQKHLLKNSSILFSKKGLGFFSNESFYSKSLKRNYFFKNLVFMRKYKKRRLRVKLPYYRSDLFKKAKLMPVSYSLKLGKNLLWASLNFEKQSNSLLKDFNENVQNEGFFNYKIQDFLLLQRRKHLIGLKGKSRFLNKKRVSMESRLFSDFLKKNDVGLGFASQENNFFYSLNRIRLLNYKINIFKSFFYFLKPLYFKLESFVEKKKGINKNVSLGSSNWLFNSVFVMDRLYKVLLNCFRTIKFLKVKSINIKGKVEKVKGLSSYYKEYKKNLEFFNKDFRDILLKKYISFRPSSYSFLHTLILKVTRSNLFFMIKKRVPFPGFKNLKNSLKHARVHRLFAKRTHRKKRKSKLFSSLFWYGKYSIPKVKFLSFWFLRPKKKYFKTILQSSSGNRAYVLPNDSTASRKFAPQAHKKKNFKKVKTRKRKLKLLKDTAWKIGTKFRSYFRARRMFKISVIVLSKKHRIPRTFVKAVRRRFTRIYNYKEVKFGVGGFPRRNFLSRKERLEKRLDPYRIRKRIHVVGLLWLPPMAHNGCRKKKRRRK